MNVISISVIIVWLPGGPKMTDRVWKFVYPEVFGHSKQLLQNKFFDQITPFLKIMMVDDYSLEAG